LLAAYDTHGNLLLFALAVVVLLRRQGTVIAAIRCRRPSLADCAAALALFCTGALTVYRGYPSMDEYVAVFQAQAFAAAGWAGSFSGAAGPVAAAPSAELFHRFARHGRGLATGRGSRCCSRRLPGSAFPGRKPVISALTLPAVPAGPRDFRVARGCGLGGRPALASPVFVISALSYYSMPAHLFCGCSTPCCCCDRLRRAALAGFVGSLALTLHNRPRTCCPRSRSSPG
jgi:hypothetical protein